MYSQMQEWRDIKAAVVQEELARERLIRRVERKHAGGGGGGRGGGGGGGRTSSEDVDVTDREHVGSWWRALGFSN